MTALAPGSERTHRYQRLTERNRRVAVLRHAVPALGAVVLAALVLQIYLGGLGGRFSIGQLSVTPDGVAVDAPQYSGVMKDGSFYRVEARVARAHLQRPDLIALSEAQLEVTRTSGVVMTADAAQGQLDTTNQLVIVPGVTEIADSTGTKGTLQNSVFDMTAQVLTSEGPVAIDYADGATVQSAGLVYDATAAVWTFSRAVVTLPATPGE